MDFYYEVGDRRALKVLLLLEFCPQLKVQLKEIGQLEGRQNSPYNPYHTLLVINDRIELFQPYAIMRYLASQAKTLYGENLQERCLIDQWISHHQNTFLPPLNQLYEVILGHKMVTRNRYLSLNDEIKQHLQRLDGRVKIQSFICGSYMSLADLELACDLYLAYRLILTDKYKKNISYLMKWYERVRLKQEFQKVFGHQQPCKKELIPEIFLHEDMMMSMSDRSIMYDKKDSISMVPSEEALPQFQPQPSKRNSLAFDYFRELVRQGEDRKLKIGLFWTVFDILQCSIWKVQYSSKEFAGKQAEVLHATYLQLLEKIKLNLNEEQFGWLGIYGDTTKQLRGVLCLCTLELPHWFKTQPLAKFQLTRLSPGIESERQVIEQHWCNVMPGQLCQSQRVVEASFLSC